jgi:hypothetical protein
MLTLKYLFIAEYTDGTIFKQLAKDVSATDPLRSSFYDVLNSGKEIKKFSLTDGEDVYSVNLEDGYFDVNGKSFFTGEPLPLPAKLRLIFYREHRHHFNRSDRQELAHEIDYVIGWQTTIKKKNYQQILRVS